MGVKVAGMICNNKSDVMVALSNAKAWKRTRKKSYSVYVCRPKLGTKCSNKFEDTQYVTDQNKQFILSGTAAENRVIDAVELQRTYMFSNGEPITPDQLMRRCYSSGEMDWVKLTTRPDVNYNLAVFLPREISDFPVQTSWGDTLIANRRGIDHGAGDFLVCSDAGGVPNLRDMWVVNGVIFSKTYDMHAFPGLGISGQSETVLPDKRFVQPSSQGASGNVASGYNTDMSERGYHNMLQNDSLRIATRFLTQYAQAMGVGMRGQPQIISSDDQSLSTPSMREIKYHLDMIKCYTSTGNSLVILVQHKYTDARERNTMVQIEVHNGRTIKSIGKVVKRGIINKSDLGVPCKEVSDEDLMGLVYQLENLEDPHRSRSRNSGFLNLSIFNR